MPTSSSWRTGRLATALVLSILAMAVSGCEDDDPSSSSVPSVPAGPAPVTGRERVAWDQPGPSLDAVRGYTFNAFVDSAMAGALSADCSGNAGSSGYTCVAPLPRLSPGAHVLTIQAMDRGGVSSLMSSGLSIVVSAAQTAAIRTLLGDAMPAVTRVCLGESAGRSCYDLQRLSSQLPSPERPRALPDGRIVVVDQGRLFELQSNQVRAVTIDTPPGVSIGDVSPSPDFARTREVYVLEVSNHPDRREADIVRFRDVNGILGQRAVIVPDIPLPADGDPALLVDDRILVAIPRDREQMQTGLGVVLQYDRDGGSAGRRVGSPVLAWGSSQPTALLKFGDSIGLIGVAPGDLVFGMLAPGATIPAANALADRLASAGGVRALARTAQLMLIATGDGSLHLGGAGPDGQLATLQRVDTRGAAITGLAATRDGGIVATTLLPALGGTPRGAIFQLTPVPSSNAH